MPSNDDVPDSGAPTGTQFATTHWSVVFAAGQRDEPQAGEALERLSRTCWYPLYAFARRKGHPRSGPLARERDSGSPSLGGFVIRGNIIPVTVLRRGTPETVSQVVAEGHGQGGSRYIVGASCEVPRDTPAEKVRALADYARGQPPAQPAQVNPCAGDRESAS